MKHCGICDKDKPLSEFNRKGAGYQSRCRECQKASYKKYYDNPTSQEKERLLASNRARREAIRSLIREHKNVPCTDCKIKYPYYVMDFDHLGDKVFDIARMVAQASSLQSVAAEIAKSEVVCSNCHRIRTHTRFDTDKIGC